MTSPIGTRTQNQALNALVFLYQTVLQIPVGDLGEFPRAKRPKRLPVVMTQEEVRRLFEHLDGLPLLMARLLYGSGMRLAEMLSLRVKDLDFAARTIHVRHGKGGKDRVTVLPENLVEPLRRKLAHARALFDQDRAQDLPGVHLPYALEAKYRHAGKQWPWFWVFPAAGLSTDPRTRLVRRHHEGDFVIQRPLKAALHAAASPSTPRRTPSAIVSPPICWKTTTTSAPSRSCSVTPTSSPHRSTPTSSTNPASAFEARLIFETGRRPPVVRHRPLQAPSRVSTFRSRTVPSLPPVAEAQPDPTPRASATRPTRNAPPPAEIRDLRN